MDKPTTSKEESAQTRLLTSQRDDTSSAFDISNVTDIDRDEEVIDDKQIEKSLNRESDEDKLIQNTNEFDFTAPLQEQETEEGPNETAKNGSKQPFLGTSKSNNYIDSNASSLTNSNQRGVKFLSDYSVVQQASSKLIDDANEPLLGKKSTDDPNTSSSTRFKVTKKEVKASKINKGGLSGSGSTSSKGFAPGEIESKFFVDENGRLIIEKQAETKEDQGGHYSDEESHPYQSKLSRENSVKPMQLKYNRASKSLEVSINIGSSDETHKEQGCFSQLKFISFYQALFAEFFGTYLLVLYVCSFGLPIAHQLDTVPGINGDLGSGLVVASLVWCLGHIGGANLNPAVSIALLLTGESNIVRVIFYILFQMLGSTAAVFTLVSILPSHLTINSQNPVLPLTSSANSTLDEPQVEPLRLLTLGLTLVNENITPGQAFGVECIITFILIFCVFACIDNERSDLNGSFPLTIGLAVTVGCLFGGKFTGASMNPARSFGPAFVMQNWCNHWVYWVGPITGGIIAGFLYKLLVVKKRHLIKT